jgi:uncharacterized membrane protein (DUF2068 family)
MSSRRSDTVLVLIGIFKLVKTSLLVLVAVGAGSRGMHHWIFQAQPSNHYLRELVAKIASASPHDMHLVEILAVFYAALFGIEGIGLILRKAWAEYFTTIVTVSFIPLEIYEMVEHANAVKVLVIAANVAIVIYLLIRLKHDGRWPWKARGAEALAAG